MPETRRPWSAGTPSEDILRGKRAQQSVRGICRVEYLGVHLDSDHSGHGLVVGLHREHRTRLARYRSKRVVSDVHDVVVGRIELYRIECNAMSARPRNARLDEKRYHSLVCELRLNNGHPARERYDIVVCRPARRRPSAPHTKASCRSSPQRWSSHWASCVSSGGSATSSTS